MTDQPAPETTAKLAAATEESSATASPPSDWPSFAHALEIQRNAARAERDELNRQLSVALKGKRPYSAEFADETIASQVKRIAELEEKLNGWFSERNAARAERDALAKERDDANALSISLCADRDGDAKDRDDEIAVLRAERILAWKENTKQRHELDEVWAKIAECRTALEMIASADGATTPGTAAWASAEIARAALATLSK